MGYKIKRFANTQPYPSTIQRIKTVGRYGAVGALLGGAGGSIFGKKGAMAGAVLGGLASGRQGWKDTSKRVIDQQNKRIIDNENRKKEIRENPRILFKSLDNDIEITKGFKTLESKYNIKFPEQLYKLIKIRKQFIPTLVDLYKKNNSLKFWSIIFEIDPLDTEYWIKEKTTDNDNIMLLIDPDQADDTWITWNIKSNTFGYETDGKGKFKTLKDLLISNIKDTIKEITDYLKNYPGFFYKREDLELAEKYYQLISSKL